MDVLEKESEPAVKGLSSIAKGVKLLKRGEPYEAARSFAKGLALMADLPFLGKVSGLAMDVMAAFGLKDQDMYFQKLEEIERKMDLHFANVYQKLDEMTVCLNSMETKIDELPDRLRFIVNQELTRNEVEKIDAKLESTSKTAMWCMKNPQPYYIDILRDTVPKLHKSTIFIRNKMLQVKDKMEETHGIEPDEKARLDAFLTYLLAIGTRANCVLKICVAYIDEKSIRREHEEEISRLQFSMDDTFQSWFGVTVTFFPSLNYRTRCNGNKFGVRFWVYDFAQGSLIPMEYRIVDNYIHSGCKEGHHRPKGWCQCRNPKDLHEKGIPLPFWGTRLCAQTVHMPTNCFEKVHNSLTYNYQGGCPHKGTYRLHVEKFPKLCCDGKRRKVLFYHMTDRGGAKPQVPGAKQVLGAIEVLDGYIEYYARFGFPAEDSKHKESWMNSDAEHQLGHREVQHFQQGNFRFWGRNPNPPP